MSVSDGCAWTNDSPLRTVRVGQFRIVTCLRATFSVGESRALYVLALCIVCWSVGVSTHLVVHQRSAIWMMVIAKCAWEARYEHRLADKDSEGGRTGRLTRREPWEICFSRVWLVKFCGLACLVYIATCVVHMPRRRTRIATRTRRAEFNDSGRPYRYRSGSIMCSIETHCLLTTTATRHHIEPLTPLLAGICRHWLRLDSTCRLHGVGILQGTRFCAGAYNPACGARDRGEDGADVCLYATAYLYQTCRPEYVLLQICRAAIGGQMSY